MIKVINSSLKGVKKIVPNLYHDNRGKFYEGWNEKIYKEITGGLKFCQDKLVNLKCRGFIINIQTFSKETSICFTEKYLTLLLILEEIVPHIKNGIVIY